MAEQEEYMLTTFDNPFNPFTDYKAWYSYDLMLGHNTAGLLGRMVISSNDLSDSDQRSDVEDAMNRILKEDVLGIYRKITASEKPIVLGP